MTRELVPCRRCGRVPALVPYEQSIDGNHDRPARVVCPCGSGHVLTLAEFYDARTRVPPGERGLGFFSEAEIEAINDRAAEAWNDEQTGRRVMDKSCITMTDDDDWWLERITMDGEQRYPERIRVGSLERPLVYVPERTCRMGAPIDGEYRCGECGHLNRETYRADKGWYPPEYCAHCGARVVKEEA